MDAVTSIGEARYRRWRLARRRVRSLERAGEFVADVGIAVLFPAEGVAVPSLWEAVAGPDAEPFAGGTMGEAESLVWEWKERLPLRGLAWYGRFVRGRSSFLAPDLLAALYPGAGTPEDHAALTLSADAHRLAEALAVGPQPSFALRQLLGRKRYERAVTELQRALIATAAGVEERATGWPGAVIDLTCRRFDVEGRHDPAYAAARFLDTVLAATAADLARAFRWPVALAGERLDALVADGRAARDGPRYVAARATSPGTA